MLAINVTVPNMIDGRPI